MHVAAIDVSRRLGRSLGVLVVSYRSLALGSTFPIFGVRGFIAAFISSGLFDLMNDPLHAGAFKNLDCDEKGKRQPIAALQINGNSRV